MTIDIICPLYNAEEYILSLHQSLLRQKDVKINKINYILTRSSDNTEIILKENKIPYTLIEANEFSHSLTREKVALKSKADILVFITQDIIINRNDYLINLVKPIIDGNVEATFSRQVAKDKNIEKYTREKNYPKESYVVSKNDLDRLGIRTFFFSDASSAIKKDIFVKLNGYDNKDLPTNEDMYFAYKLIMNGYKIRYCSESVVIHSHHLSFKQLYKRYFDTGLFFKYNDYLNQYHTKKSGLDLAKYVFKRALKDFNLKVLFRYPIDMIIRYKAMRDGEKYERHS